MAQVIGFCGTRQGVGATVRLVSLGWELAKTRQVMIVDLDAAGGTVVDFLQLETANRTVANLYSSSEISAGALEEQAVRAPGRERLRVVPAVRAGCGVPPHVLLPKLAQGLHELPDDLVLVDLGVPLAYPGLANIPGAGQVLSATLNNLVVFMWDDHLTLALQIQMLRLARLSSAQVVINSQHRKLAAEARHVLEREARDLVVKLEWPWSRDLWSQPLAAAAQAEVLGLA